jgi:hypothetical protein
MRGDPVEATKAKAEVELEKKKTRSGTVTRSMLQTAIIAGGLMRGDPEAHAKIATYPGTVTRF